MHGRSLLAQIMILVFLVLVAPAAIVTSYNLYKNFSYAEEEIAETAISQVRSVSATNEMVLFNLVKSTLRLVQSGTFKQIRGMESYDELNEGYENISKAMKLQTLFDDLLMNEEGVHSAYFILEGSDYVVSSDRGISRLEAYRPQGWLEDVLADLDSLSGIWIARDMPLVTREQEAIGYRNSQTIPVLSYVYTLKTFDSSIKGTVVVNVYVEDIYGYLNPQLNHETTETYLVDQTGRIVVDKEEGQLYASQTQAPYYQKILEDGEREGYFYMEEAGERYLYVYRRTDFANWLYISRNNISAMTLKVRQNNNESVLLIGLTTLVGSIIVFILMYKTLRPVRQLVASLQSSTEQGIEERNELMIISKAFDHMKEEGNALSKMLEDKESDAIRLVIRDALKGEQLPEQGRRLIQSVLPYEHMMVAFVGIDHQQAYDRQLNDDERTFHRFQIVKLVEATLEAYQVAGRAVRHAEGITATVMSFKTYDRIKTNQLVVDICQTIREQICDQLSCTVTIGLSSIHSGDEAMEACANEAHMAYRYKLSLGTNRLISWKEYMAKEDQFYYPHNQEEKILNYVKLRDKQGVKQALEAISDHLVRHSDLSVGNILFIYNQLSGTIIRYLSEQQISTDAIFDQGGYIYEEIANLETIEEIERAIYDFASSVIDYLGDYDDGADQGYYQQIIQYMEQHYKKNIDFEGMAEVIGISYSYMRKIIQKEMNKSLLDCLNAIRIEKAKALMEQASDLRLVDVALEVGYANAQSFNRYFKKFEGVTPSMYRQINTN